MKPIVLVVIIAGLGLVKHFWFLNQSMFEADQEYLALAGKSILEGDFTLLGAPTSAGGMFVGPLYNYLVAVVLWVFKGNPLVVNGLSAVWVTAATVALYLVGRLVISESVGIFAATIGLFSYNFVNHAQVPPLLFPLPLISLLFIAVAESSMSKRSKALTLGVLVGLALNLHFSGIFLFPFLLAFGWEWAIPLAGLLSPLLLFEARHQGMISRNILQFASSSIGAETGVWSRFETLAGGIADLVNAQATTGAVFPVSTALLLAVLVFGKSIWMRLISATVMVFFVSYSGMLLPYYGIVTWPLFILFLGQILAGIWNRYPQFRPAVVLLVGVWGMSNTLRWSQWSSGRSIDKKLAALRYIKAEAGSQPMYLSKTIEPAADFGFTYLPDYVGVRSSGRLSDWNYTIVIPARWQGIKPDVQFGDIGIVLPKESDR